MDLDKINLAVPKGKCMNKRVTTEGSVRNFVTEGKIRTVI